MPESGSTTCAVCGRVILTAHANASGRCVYCAGKPADDAIAAVNAPIPTAAAIQDGTDDEPVFEESKKR